MSLKTISTRYIWASGIFIICLLFSACQTQSSNPDSEKVKELQDEVINLKLQTEKISQDIAKQNRDLEIIKQHLVPSYKARVKEEEVTITETTTEIESEATETETSEKSEEKEPANSQVTAPDDKNAIKTSKTSRRPETTVQKPVSAEATKPATNNVDKINSDRNPPENYKIAEPKPKKIESDLPPGRKIPEKKIPETKNPEPKPPATSNQSRNIVYTFSDIMDHPFRQYIGVLHTIGGILDRDSGLFEPEETISKAEYLTWLFKTYNAYHANSAPAIKPGTVSFNVFDDVSSGHRAHPYIQGLAEAGLIKDFSGERILHPDDPITREELIAFTEYLQRGTPGYKLAQLTPEFCKLYINSFVSDGKDVNLNYARMIYRNLNESNLINNTFYVFKKEIHVFIPQKAVTRAQAAASLCFIEGMEPQLLGFKVKNAEKTDT